MSLKNSNDTIGNRILDLPVCSVVPYPLRHRTPLPNLVLVRNDLFISSVLRLFYIQLWLCINYFSNWMMSLVNEEKYGIKPTLSWDLAHCRLVAGLPTRRDNLLVPSSRVNSPRRLRLSGCHETSVTSLRYLIFQKSEGLHYTTAEACNPLHRNYL
jgi:hypothetical protein